MALRNVTGHEKAVAILLGTLKQNRVASSYLFTGESGIGKKLTAINFAKALNCINPQDSDACDACSSCRKIDSQTHPDFLMASPEKGEIRVEEIRTIEQALSYTPFEGKRKIVIIDDAETMNLSAANAFLKTLEEPPPQCLIILVAASPDRLPETIRSRCSRISFASLSPEKCEQIISTSIKTDDKIPTLARLSMGRPGLAISEELIEDRDRFMSLFTEMMSIGSKNAWSDKEEMSHWFDTAFTVLRDIMVLKITGDRSLLINSDLSDRIANAGKTAAIQDIIDSYMKISFLKGRIEFNLNRPITWNYLSFALKKIESLAL